MRLVLALLLAPAVAHADVDWAKGIVTAPGVGVADRHAPNPAVARGTSRRVAEDAARAKLAGEIAALPLAGGGKVGDKAKDAAVKARLAAAVEHAISIAAEPETDGAWRVTMGVPIEAVRQALAGPRVLADAGDGPPAAVIVDGVGGKPAVGVVGAATVWVTDVPAWAKDAPHVAGKRGKGGAIEGIDVQPQALYVIVGKP
ncbi:MAG: hypothetical protein JO257_02985 [Deltaproteobacteria bacterium]|nr:hypothetical protein [Deltaproteobacteria bacterium]